MLDSSDISVTLSLYPIKGIGAVRYEMSNTDKLLLICIIGMLFGFGVALYDVSKRSYEKGLREGYHRGRSIKGQE